MTRYRELSETTARRIDRVMLGLANVGSLAELEEQFLPASGKILPADCLCWNTWAVDWSHLIACRSEEQYDRWLLDHQDLFNHHVIHHPVLMNHHISVTAERVMRMSDLQSPAEFRSRNPFFREVYRHLGFVYQLSYTAGELEDRKIILSWSRGSLDFSDLEKEIFHYMGRRLGLLSRRIAERQRLDAGWRGLCDFVDGRVSAGPVTSLGSHDLKLLAELLKRRSRASIAAGLGIRRDSLDKSLGAIRERLGLENHHQLLSLLAELRSPAGGSLTEGEPAS